MISSLQECTSKTSIEELEKLRQSSISGTWLCAVLMILNAVAFTFAMCFMETYHTKPGLLLWPILFTGGIIANAMGHNACMRSAENCALAKIILAKKKEE